MGKTTEIRCDGCDADITTTSNCEDYRLALINESIPAREGPVTLMGKRPLLDGNCYFCSLPCFFQWLWHRYAKPLTKTATGRDGLPQMRSADLGLGGIRSRDGVHVDGWHFAD